MRYITCIVIFVFLFINQTLSLNVLSSNYVTKSPSYTSKNGYCNQVQAEIVVDPGSCSSGITIEGPNIFLIFDRGSFVYNYYTITFNYSTGSYPINFDISCGKEQITYSNPNVNFQCIKPSLPNTLTLASWKPTFPEYGFTTYQMIFDSPFKYNITDLSCNSNCFFCKINTVQYQYDKVYLNVRLLEPNIIATVCSAQNFTLVITIHDKQYNFSFTNQFFIDNSKMSVLSADQYPTTNRQLYYSYLANRALWFSASLSNVSPFISTYAKGSPFELYPISGNRKSASFINAKIPELYSDNFDINFKGFTQNDTVQSSTINFQNAITHSNITINAMMDTILNSNNITSYQFPRLYGNQLSAYIGWSQDGLIYSRFDYPFGYINGTVSNSFHISLHQTGIFKQPTTTVSYIETANYPFDKNNNAFPNSNIRVNNVTLTPFGTYQYILRINVTEPIYGIFQIRSGSCVLLEKDLVVGTIYNGCYEKVCSIDYQNGQSSLDFEIRIYSKSMDNFIFRTNEFIPYTSTFLPRFNYQFNIPIGYFSKVYFASNVQNVTNQTVKNYFIFNVTNPIKTFKPILEILNSDFNGNRKQFVGEWNETIGLYIIPITIPMNYFEGLVPYRLLTLPQSINNAEFFSIFGNQSQLYLESKNCDMIGPLVENIYVQRSGGQVFSWIIVLIDEVNGFKEGYVNITSTMNPYPFRYNLTRSLGDIYNGTFVVNFAVTTFVDQNLTLSLWAIDNGGNMVTSYIFDRNIAQYQTNSRPILYGDPFMKIYGTSMESQLHAYYNFSATEKNPPQFVNMFLSNNTVDVGLPDMTIIINFTVSDNSGILTESPPQLYISSLYDEIVQFTPNIITNAGGIANYGVVAKIPYGFGSSAGLFLSLYGVCDIVGNIIGVNPIFLQAYSSGILVRNFTKDIPNLERYDPISKKGGILTVYGNQFGMNPMDIGISVKISQSTILLVSPNDILNVSNSFIIFKTYEFPVNNKYSIQVSRVSKFSNVLEIIGTESEPIPDLPPPPTDKPTTSPTDTPSNTPTNTATMCPGSPKPCSGNGNCINSQCICNQNWYGPDCASELVPAPPPVINPNQPETNTTIISPTQNTIISTLSIVSLREIDGINQVVTDYNLTNHNWTFKNTTNPMNNYIEYQYSTSINTTNLSVKIQYFSKETNVSFAGEYYLMTASSIKYSMMISNYDFKSKLNGLQVVLSATLVGGQGDCTSRSFGSNKTSNGIEDIQWVKLKVGYESLYGRFLQNAVIDNNRVIQITNILLDDQYQAITSSSSATQTYIGINIPQFEQNVYIDPDFSILVDNSPASQDSNSKCNESSPKKLTSSQIAGIAIACSVVFISVIGVTIYIKLKNKKQHKIEKNLHLKMKQITED